MGEERWEGVSDSLVDSVPSLRPGSPGLRVSGSPGPRVSGSPGLRVSVYIVRGLSVCARIPLIAGDSMLAIWNLKLTRALRKRNFTSSPPLTMQTPWVQGPVRNPLSYLPTLSHHADTGLMSFLQYSLSFLSVFSLFWTHHALAGHGSFWMYLLNCRTRETKHRRWTKHEYSEDWGKAENRTYALMDCKYTIYHAHYDSPLEISYTCIR